MKCSTSLKTGKKKELRKINDIIIRSSVQGWRYNSILSGNGI